MGRITKPHGLRGEVVVVLITDRVERLAQGSVLTGRTRTLEVVSSRPHQGGHIVAFVGVKDRSEAESLRGEVLTATPLEDADTLWVHELIGSHVFDREGKDHGPVVAVQANPASDLLVLEGGQLVPLRFMVSNEPGRCEIDPPVGLFD